MCSLKGEKLFSVLFGFGCFGGVCCFGGAFFYPFAQRKLLADGEDVVDENIEGESGGIIEHNEGEENGHHPRKHEGLGFLHHLGLEFLRNNHRHAQQYGQEISWIFRS